MEISELDLQYSEPKRIFRKPEPITRRDYLKIIIAITKRPAKDIAILTSHWPMEWFYHVASECKLKKDEVSKAKFINWFIKESRTKETNLTQI